MTRYMNNDGIFQNFQTLGIETKDKEPPIFQISTLLQVERLWLKP